MSWFLAQFWFLPSELLDTVEWKGKFYDLVDVPVVDAPNLVLEYFNNEKVLGNFVYHFSKALPLLPL